MARKPAFPPPIHKHSSGQARVYWKGQVHYLGLYGSAEAQAAYARLVEEIRSTGNASGKAREAALSVKALVSEWERHMGRRYAASSREPVQFRRALAVVLRLYGHQPAASFDTLALMNVQQAMASGSWMTEEEKARSEKKKRRIDWCRNVVNRQIVRIRTVWRWAESRKLVPVGTWSSLLTVEGLGRNDPTVRHTKPQVAANFEDVKKVLKHCGATVQTMLLVQWWSGCRSGEVRLMRREEIDCSGEVWYYRPTSHKMAYKGQERVIPLGRKCQAVLRPYLAKAGLLFEARPGSPYSMFSYAQHIRRAARKANVQGFHGYLCRHAAKQRLTRQFGLDAARAVLGQKSLGTTNGYASQQDLLTATQVAGKAC
jgi:integrase